LSIPDVSPELPAPQWRALLRLLRMLPQGAFSRGFGRVADTPLPRRVRRPVLLTFARLFGIDVGEAEKDIAEYASINAFFVRRLRPGLRPIDTDPFTAVSPVDGIIGQFGLVRRGRLVQAKGRDYSVASLLADESAARTYENGSFLTIYLSPRHYHRIHAPIAGGITQARHIPGALLPVNGPSVAHVPELFPRNERLQCRIDGGHGDCTVVAVGAYNVGRISAAFDASWQNGGTVTNRPRAAASLRRYEPPVLVDKGAEIMAFHLGSTVVLLFDRALRFTPAVSAGSEIRIGVAIASMS
jgi:phosphatidylserine decarboxylase